MKINTSIKLWALIALTIIPALVLADSPIMPVRRGFSTTPQVQAIQDTAGATRINIPATTTTTLTSTQPTTGSAVGTVIDTNSTYVLGDSLLSIRNNGTQKAYIDFGGSLVLSGSAIQSVNTNAWSVIGGVNDSGGAKTALRFQNISSLTNSSSNIWCGYSDNGVTSQLCLRKDGSLIPSVNNTSSLGITGNAFGNGVFGGTVYANIWQAVGSNSSKIIGSQSDSASSVGNKFGNANALVTSGAQIAAFYNDNLSTLKSNVDLNGGYTVNGSGSITTTSGGLNIGGASNLGNASANYVNVTGGSTGNPPIISAAGEANRDIGLRGNGTGGVALAASRSNYIYIPSEAVGSPSQINAAGSDTNIDLKLNPKGTGGVQIATKVSSYNGTATAGMGVSPIYAYGSATATTSTGTTLATYTPTTNSVFKVGGFLDVSAFTSGQVSIQVNFTDCTGTARSWNMQGVTNGAIVVGNLSATGSLAGFDETICASSAAAINLKEIITGTATADFYAHISQVN